MARQNHVRPRGAGGSEQRLDQQVRPLSGGPRGPLRLRQRRETLPRRLGIFLFCTERALGRSLPETDVLGLSPPARSSREYVCSVLSDTEAGGSKTWHLQPK